jgi:hypothetical protein
VGITAIADALRVNGSLTSLNLRENWIGAEGAKALAPALAANGSLIGPGQDFAKFDSKFAGARSTPKSRRNLRPEARCAPMSQCFVSSYTHSAAQWLTAVRLYSHVKRRIHERRSNDGAISAVSLGSIRILL